jgi:hypothetical protein
MLIYAAEANGTLIIGETQDVKMEEGESTDVSRSGVTRKRGRPKKNWV